MKSKGPLALSYIKLTHLSGFVPKSGLTKKASRPVPLPEPSTRATRVILRTSRRATFVASYFSRYGPDFVFNVLTADICVGLRSHLHIPLLCGSHHSRRRRKPASIVSTHWLWKSPALCSQQANCGHPQHGREGDTSIHRLCCNPGRLFLSLQGSLTSSSSQLLFALSSSPSYAEDYEGVDLREVYYYILDFFLVSSTETRALLQWWNR
jgi:hypothetical protein